MKIGFKAVLFLLILNLVSTMVYAIQIPGTTYTGILYGGSQANATEYAEEFNTTTLLDRWTATPFSGIPIFGDIFSGIMLLFNAIRSIIVGFPDLINSIAYSIVDTTARNAVLTVNYVIYAVFAFITFLWMFQLITGRKVSD